MQVEAIFLGEPRLRIDKIEKTLGKNKLDALLFYLLFHEEMEREEVSSVFWPGHDAIRAKSSLRNSLYEIRRILGVDLFSASTRDRIVLGRDVIMLKDVDELLAPGRSMAYADEPAPVFMQRCELKNNPVFENWLLTIREAYQGIFLGNLRAALQELPQGSPQILPLARRILALDSYDEWTLRILMTQYAEAHQFNEALAAFRRTQEVLLGELGVEPEPETLRLVQAIAQRRGLTQEGPRQGLQNTHLLMQLQERLDEFFSGKSPRHVLVFGDPGTGRTHLIETFLETTRQRACTLRLDYPNKQIPEGFLMKWSRQFLGRPQEDFRNLLLNLPAEPLILVVQNLEFMDHKSLLYLTDFLSASQSQIFCILEATREFIMRNDAIAFLVQNADLAQIEVPLLSRAGLAAYLETGPGSQRGEQTLDAVYAFSRGNLVLASEYLNPEGQMERLFIRLTAGLSEEEKSIMEAASVHPEGFTPQMARIHLPDSQGMMKTLRSLVQRGLLVEEGERLTIIYPPLRQWIYERLPHFYRVHLHELAAGAASDLGLSQRQAAMHQAWHWKMAGHRSRALLHELSALELALNFFDQMYPATVDPLDLPVQVNQQRQQLHSQLEGLIREIHGLEGQMGDEAGRLELIADYLQGRRFIAGGRREEGILLIRDVTEQASRAGDGEYLLKAVIESVHYAIQKEDLDLMGDAIHRAEDLLAQSEWTSNQSSRAEVLRLAGLYAFSRGSFRLALEQLEEADSILKDPRYRATGFLARAGTLNYLARTREAMGDLAGADEAFRLSIELVRGRVHKCLDTLYADYGRFLWTSGRQAEASEILARALEEYQILGTHWKRTSTEAILGLIALERSDIKSARSHLINAQIYHKADRRQGEAGLIEQLWQGVHDRTR